MCIKELAIKYNDFQNEFGISTTNFTKIIENLFAENFSKTANREVIVGNRNELETQLTSVKDIAGKWQIMSKYIIPSEDGKFCTIRYELYSEKAGNFDILAVLNSTDGMRINSVDEIYIQVKLIDK